MLGSWGPQVSEAVQRVSMVVGGFLVANPWAAETKYGQIAGAAIVLAGIVFGFKTNTVPALVAKVDAIAKLPDSPVQAVITTADAKGMELANSLPGSTTVPAGTVQAAAIARAA